MRSTAIALFLLLAAAGSALADENHITVYNKDLALIKQVRTLELPKEGPLAFTDVAARLIPTSVHLRSISGEGNLTVLEQNFAYDLVSSEKILDKYIDHPVEVVRENGELTRGILLSRQGRALVLKTEGGIRLLSWNDKTTINVKALPEGLITRPTLLWELSGGTGKRETVEVSYLSSGMDWNAEYVGVLSADGTRLNLDAWVSVNNRSGMTFTDARLKLVAGEVGRAPEHGRMRLVEMAQEPMMAKRAPKFEERALFEYHIYELDRPTTLTNNQIKQLSLFAPTEVVTEKAFVYNAAMDPKRITARLLFDNKAASGLGKPLPAGIFRIYQKDRESLEFVGEDRIDHSPRNKQVKITLGKAFDLTAERKVVRQEKVSSRAQRQTIEIVLSNAKPEEEVTVTVEEEIHCGEWKIEEANFPHTVEEVTRATFRVPVPADGKSTLRYTRLCTW